MTQNPSKGQSDGLNPENQVSRANTRSSRESSEILCESQKLLEPVADSVTKNDPSPAPTVLVEETIENTEPEKSKVIWSIAKKIICIILGTICILFIVAECCIVILFVLSSILAEYPEDKILIKNQTNPDEIENSEKSSEPKFFDMITQDNDTFLDANNFENYDMMNHQVSYTRPIARIIVYEDKPMFYENYDTYYDNFLPNSCKTDEYEITVRMSSNVFSGTDDKVNIRLHGQNGETTEWFKLTKPRCSRWI